LGLFKFISDFLPYFEKINIFFNIIAKLEALIYYFIVMKAKVMKLTALFFSKFNYLSKKPGASLTKFWNYYIRIASMFLFSPLFILFFFFLLSHSSSSSFHYFRLHRHKVIGIFINGFYLLTIWYWLINKCFGVCAMDLFFVLSQIAFGYYFLGSLLLYYHTI
jgi:hypothetical protein